MDIIFYDLEASGLGAESYPIEVAWRCPEKGTHDSFFINPESATDWLYWDDFAEELHGIDRGQLVDEGIDIVVACLRLNSVLEGKLLISDALEFDSFWMRRLFEAADIQPMFTMGGLERVLSAEQLIQYRFIARSQFRRHRAMQDVDDLMIAVQAVSEEAV